MRQRLATGCGLIICVVSASCGSKSKPNYQQAMAAAETAFKARDYGAATNHLSAALKLNATNADAWCLKGMSRWWLGDLARAMADYDRAVALAPGCARYYCNRGQALFSMCKCTEALADYDKSIQLDPNGAASYFNRGSLEFLCRGNITNAISDYTRAIELGTDSAPADIYFIRGAAQHHLANFAAAIADYSTALKLNGSQNWPNAVPCRDYLVAAKARMQPPQLKALVNR